MYHYRPGSAFYRAPGERLTAGHIRRFMKTIGESGIDTFVVNPSGQQAWYPSKVVPTILDGYRRGDRSHFFGHLLGQPMSPEFLVEWLDAHVHLLDSYLDLVEDGVDWLAETIASTQAQGMHAWVSARMNDMHGATQYIPGSYLNAELFKDPSMRLPGTTYNPQAAKNVAWEGFDYRRPEVREHMFAILQDLVENYDATGLELDWSRWPLCCEPGADEATVAMITDWHREIRALVDRRSAALGRRYVVGMKFVGTPEQLRSIGLDVVTMAQEGILDYVSPTNSWQSSWDLPLDRYRQVMGDQVAIYGVVEMVPNSLRCALVDGERKFEHYRLTPAAPTILRGNAAAKLALGVDGIEVYNYNPADQDSHWPVDDKGCRAHYEALGGIADAEGLRGQPKFYTWSSQNGTYAHALFESIGPFPVRLEPGHRREARLPMLAEAVESGLDLWVQVVVDCADELPPIGISMNDGWPTFEAVRDDRLLVPVGAMTHHLASHMGLCFHLSVGVIREGWNKLMVMLDPIATAAVTIHSVELAVLHER